MAAETLNFGPEWLRALSSGGSLASPPPSPAMPKYKLAEYRYGREEMLALYVKENKVPEEILDKEFAAILQEEPLQPLALVPLTEEEQRNFSMSVNSVAVLRLMGKGGGAAPTGVSRGRGSTRSRGRGRGESAFYQRSPEEAEGAFGRGGREIHRSQSWDDRGERRFEKPTRRDGTRAPFEEGPPPRKDYARSDSNNWRTLREEHEEEEEGGGGAGPTPAGGAVGGSWRLSGGRRESDRWRSASPDGAPRSAGWREHPEGRRRKFDFDFREREEERGGRRHRGSDAFEDDKDGLPEWCMDDEDEEMGTFDSSGAFMPLKKSPKEPIPEEQEFDFHPLQEEDERLKLKEDVWDGSEPSLKEAPEKEARKDPSSAPEEKCCSPPGVPWLSGPPFAAAITTATSECESAPLGGSDPTAPIGTCDKEPAVEGDPGVLGLQSQLSPDAVSTLSSPSSITNAATEFSIGDNEDDDGMKHLQQEAEKMVASLQESSLEEEGFSQAMQEPRNTAAALPLSHEAAMKWFYKDPQGEIQGPFTTQEMAEWFQAGYFTMSLLVKRGCDEGFQPLGEVIKMWGRVPFAPGPSPPPLLGNLDQERLKKQQELAAAALYQQLQHQQFLQLINRYLPDSRQQFAPCALQQKVATGDLTQQQLTAFLQQLQALKPRAGEQSMMPAMNRSMSVPDTGSLWDTHTSASQPAGGEASLWDIPINSSSQGPILEQLQLQQKLQERRDAELRAKREEEERKRREEKRRQEEQKRREEEELYRRKQCRQQELVLKLLQHSQAQTVPWGGLTKPPGGMKALLELQESERQLQKQQRAQQRAHGALAMNSHLSQWGADSSQLWSSHEKNMSLWEETVKNAGPLVRSMGLKNSRSSPSLGDTYGGPGRQSRKKTDEEEKLLKLLQGFHKPQDGFTQWCEQMLHALNTSSSLDVPTVVAFLKEMESPYDVHDFIRSYLGDTLEAKEFAKQFLERRAKQKASQQRQQQQEASWLSSGNLPSLFPANHSSKQPPFEGSQPVKIKRRPVMLHADPSILGRAEPAGSPGHLGSLPSSWREVGAGELEQGSLRARTSGFSPQLLKGSGGWWDRARGTAF
ncbi:GRB10-interacting GYF protein 1 isoform X4 [Pelodiscus sinensis]|uniref:GRB10-interacting GYF protein 1 isoform X4 n=1 Tax=Pelodiscus sinensis TaxID=13735 RepID=UPI003F6B4ADF